jgi:hypothetical protein
LHSWTIPSFGVKVDACPGRLNQANLFIKRFGVFFGQCSEICCILVFYSDLEIVQLFIKWDFKTRQLLPWKVFFYLICIYCL